MQKPTSRDYESIKNWLLDVQPLVQSEIAYILRKEDIVTLRKGRESAAFDSFVERMLSRLDEFLKHRCQWHLIEVCRNGKFSKEET